MRIPLLAILLVIAGAAFTERNRYKCYSSLTSSTYVANTGTLSDFHLYPSDTAEWHAMMGLFFSGSNYAKINDGTT